MAYKDENVVRVDVRIPNKFYSEIERCAIATNQPPTPKSKNTDNPKPSVTTIILKLIELGLGVIENEGIEVLGEGNITPVPNPHISDKIEDKLFKRLEARLEQLLEQRFRADKFPKIENSDNYELITEDIEKDNYDLIREDIKEDNSEIKNKIVDETITSEIMIENEIIERVSSGNNNEDNEYVKNLNAIEVTNDDTEAITPSENTEVKSLGLSMGKLAERFKSNKNQGEGASKTTISSKYKKLSKEEFINWTQENDPEGKAWQLNEADKLFYPVN